MIRFADVGNQSTRAYEHEQADGRVEIANCEASLGRQEQIPRDDCAEPTAKIDGPRPHSKADKVMTG